MALICDNCGKSLVYGRQSTHHRGVAGKRWKKRAQTTLRMFKPNLQKIAVYVDGQKTQMRLCTNCIKLFRKQGKIKKYQAPTKVASL